MNGAVSKTAVPIYRDRGFESHPLRQLGWCTVNKAWHEKNKMPARPTLEQRIKWHREHREQCGCRAIPKSLASYFSDNVVKK